MTPGSFDPRLAWNLAAALIVGALVGIERERNKALSGNLGIGGVRTFILFALAGAVGGWLSQLLHNAWIFVAVLGAVAILTGAGYLAQARVRPEDLGLTTETAAVTVCLLGGVCSVGYPVAALAVGVAVAAVLAYKESMHGVVARLGAEDISAGVKLLAATFIVLPLLPATAVDPWGALHPRSLWILVILIAALSLVGYVATRTLGAQRGTAVTGLTGGLVSSTAVTLAFARRSREEGAGQEDVLAAGVFLAWSVMFARVVVLVAVVHAPLLPPLLLPFGLMTATAALAGAFLLRRSSEAPAATRPEVALRNPFSLVAAIKFGLFFAVVLLLVTLVQRRFPTGGSYVVAALAGLTDVDAITLSMATLARDGAVASSSAIGAVVVACLSNTVVKCGLVVALARPALRRRALAVTGLLLAGGLGALLLG